LIARSASRWLFACRCTCRCAIASSWRAADVRSVCDPQHSQWSISGHQEQ
jgi:hypothetical protein